MPSLVHRTRSPTFHSVVVVQTSNTTVTVKDSLCTDNGQTTYENEITRIRNRRAPGVTTFAPFRDVQSLAVNAAKSSTLPLELFFQVRGVLLRREFNRVLQSFWFSIGTIEKPRRCLRGLSAQFGVPP